MDEATRKTLQEHGAFMANVRGEGFVMVASKPLDEAQVETLLRSGLFQSYIQTTLIDADREEDPLATGVNHRVRHGLTGAMMLAEGDDDERPEVTKQRAVRCCEELGIPLHYDGAEIGEQMLGLILSATRHQRGHSSGGNLLE